MALQGSLASFGISEILQLAGVQQKTGVLHIDGKEGEVARILLNGGRVAGCERDGGSKDDLLGRRLLAADLVTRDQLNRAVKQSRANNRRVGDELVEAKVIERGLLEHFLMLQLRERLADVFGWRQGTWRFEARPRGFLPLGGPTLSAEAALLDGMRVVEEWPLIRAKINNYEVVYRVLKRPEESESEAEALERILDDAFSEFGGDEDEAAQAGGLSVQERNVLDLVDGRLTVHDLIDRGRLGEFETCKALLALLNGGYIEPIKHKKPQENPGRRVSKGAMVTRVALNLALLGALAAGVVFLPNARGELDSNAAAVGREARYRLRSNRIVAVSNALEAYRIEHGRYPETLEALLTSGFIEARALAGAVALDYVTTGTDYDLR